MGKAINFPKEVWYYNNKKTYFDIENVTSISLPFNLLLSASNWTMISIHYVLYSAFPSTWLVFRCLNDDWPIHTHTIYPPGVSSGSVETQHLITVVSCSDSSSPIEWCKKLEKVYKTGAWRRNQGRYILNQFLLISQHSATIKGHNDSQVFPLANWQNTIHEPFILEYSNQRGLLGRPSLLGD